MNLLHTIKQTLEHTNHDELLKAMGYHNLKGGHRTLQKFLDTDNIYLFLKKGNYDLKYGSESFLRALLKALDLTSVGKDELNQCYRRLDAISAMRKAPYIFVDTHFKRACQPIFVLGLMHGRRNIGIDKESLVLLSKSEILKIISELIREHYTVHHGELDLWGKIYNYVYHHVDGSKYVFDTDGVLLQNHSEIMESRAVLKIGNQIIVGIENG